MPLIKVDGCFGAMLDLLEAALVDMLQMLRSILDLLAAWSRYQALDLGNSEPSCLLTSEHRGSREGNGGELSGMK